MPCLGVWVSICFSFGCFWVSSSFSSSSVFLVFFLVFLSYLLCSSFSHLSHWFWFVLGVWEFSCVLFVGGWGGGWWFLGFRGLWGFFLSCLSSFSFFLFSCLSSSSFVLFLVPFFLLVGFGWVKKTDKNKSKTLKDKDEEEQEEEEEEEEAQRSPNRHEAQKALPKPPWAIHPPPPPQQRQD